MDDEYSVKCIDIMLNDPTLENSLMVKYSNSDNQQELEIF